MPEYVRIIQDIRPVDVFLDGEGIDSYRCARNMICVSLYNEPPQVLRSTLLAIVENVRSAAAVDAPVGQSCICVIADGVDRLNTNTRTLLEKCGLISHATGAVGESQNFFSTHRAGALRAALGYDQGSDGHQKFGGDDEQIRVIVSLKNRNQGKLHSHALFFCNLCLRLEPEICYQIDTGAVLQPNAISAVLQHFRRAPDVGALATSGAPFAPRPEESILQLWQFMDFVTQLSVLWPAEVMSGHLGVLPGQFCAFRWAAMIDPVCAAEPVNEQRYDAIPLYRYLRGLAPQSAFVKIMFLAEDRIIGNEITLSPYGDWKLDFCNTSGASTDACSTVMELARQRRRWNNSTTACRLSQISHLPVLLARNDRVPASKFRATTGLLWQMNLMILQLITPACTIGFSLIFFQALGRWIETRGGALPLVMLACFLAWLPLVLFGTARLPQAVSKIMANVRNMLGPVVVTMQLWIVHSVMPVELFFVMFLPMAMMLVMALCFFWRDKGVILTRYVEFFLFNPVVSIALVAYSIWYLDDTSWGTKGLKRTAVTQMELELRRYRNLSMAGWLSVNTILVWLGSLRQGFIIKSVNPVIEFLLLNYLVGIFGALIFFAWRGSQNLFGNLRYD